ncbi:CAP domain-containing protein [Bacillus sp. Marseille-P3661]|uniref:CAP domain-containing protein n=1 Tax=Bacillus sp. Marseille-P3661 TaxID=1936234 RepID=UPI000C81DE6C|nr:CAP domain-containing protein [Bacillus sp. Marseille-P3661]
MKRNLLGFTIAITILSLIIIYSQLFKITESNTVSEKLNEQTEKNGQAVDDLQDILKSKEQPLYNLIGKKTKDVTAFLGQPQRVDFSEYDYNWWIYNEKLENYLQIGVENDRVVTIFAMGEDNQIGPFKIGQTLEELKSFTEIKEKVAFEVENNSYRFELTKDDLATAPLVNFNGIWAQVFIDKFTGKVSSVRFIDEKTLVKIRPYELVYRGTLFHAEGIDLDKWEQIEKGKSRQILDMTNVIRMRNGLPLVNWDEKTAEVAYSHSREMFEQEYFSHSSPKNGGLSDRLIKGGVMFKVAGENIAARYVDAISAVEGWLNSEGHRRTLLNESFTHLGVGVYEKYYTQNFIQAW